MRGVGVTAAARAVAELAALLSSFLIARLITPTEFGAAVIALLVYALAAITREHALGVPLVLHAAIDRRHVEMVAFLSVVLGLGLMVVTVALVPVAWRPLFGSRAGELTMLAALAFPIAACASVPQAQLQRRLDFRSLAAADALGALTGTASTVALALLRLGGAAIVLGMLASLLTSGAFMATRAPLVRPRFHRSVVRELTRVGVPAAAEATTFAMFQTIDYFLIGALLSLRDVGIYWRAFQLAVEHQGKVTGIMLRMGIPMYSRLEGPARNEVRSRVVRVHAMVLFPLITMLFVVAPVAIPLMYGSEWERAADLTRIMCLAGFGVVIGTGLGPLIVALGRTSALLRHTLIWLLVVAGAIVASAQYGVSEVAIAVAVTQALSSLSANYFLGSKIAGIPLKDVGRDLVAPGVSSAIMLVLTGIIFEVLRDTVHSSVAILGVTGIVGLAVYAGALMSMFPAAWRDLLLLIRTVGPRGFRASLEGRG